MVTCDKLLFCGFVMSIMKYICCIFFLCSNVAIAMDMTDSDEDFLDLDLNINYEDHVWMTLYKAIKSGDVESAKIVLQSIEIFDKYVRQNIFALKDEDGNSLLHILPALGLSYNDAFMIFEKLVVLGHPIDIQNHQGQTPLHRAVNIGCPQTCAFILGRDPELLDIPNAQGRLPIHIAAVNKNIVLLSLLLSAGAHSQLFVKDANQKNAIDYSLDSLKYCRKNYSRGISSSELNKLVFGLYAKYIDAQDITHVLFMINRSAEECPAQRNAYCLVKRIIEKRLEGENKLKRKRAQAGNSEPRKKACRKQV